MGEDIHPTECQPQYWVLAEFCNQEVQRIMHWLFSEFSLLSMHLLYHPSVHPPIYPLTHLTFWTDTFLN